MADEQKTQRSPYGFIIYRGDYSDDAQWVRCMAYLKHQARSGLESEKKAHLFNDMNWKVISSPDMQDEDPEEIHERFTQCLESGEEQIDPNNFRYRACLLLNKACLDSLDSFMEDKSLSESDDLTLFDDRGYTFALLVSRFEHEGWTLVGMSYLIPRAGDTLLMRGEYRGWAEIASVPEGDVSVGF